MRKLPAVETVVAAIRGGKSAIALAREHECSPTAVYRLLKRNGFALRAGVIHEIAAQAA